MNYEKLKKIAESRNMELKAIAELLDLTPNGLKRSFEYQSFPIKKVIKLCDLLQITPNDFFDNADSPSISQHAHHITGSVKQVAHLNTNNGACASCIEKDREIHELQAELIKLYRKNNK